MTRVYQMIHDALCRRAEHIEREAKSLIEQGYDASELTVWCDRDGYEFVVPVNSLPPPRFFFHGIPVHSFVSNLDA